MSGPLVPVIVAGGWRSVFSSVCSCCAAEDGTVVAIAFGWSDPVDTIGPRHGGGSSVALCRECRDRARAVIGNVDGVDCVGESATAERIAGMLDELRHDADREPGKTEGPPVRAAYYRGRIEALTDAAAYVRAGAWRKP